MIKHKMKLKKNISLKCDFKNKVVLIALLIFLVTYLFLKYFNNQINDVFLDYAEHKVTMETKLIINNAIKNMSLNDLNIDDLLITAKNKNDEIISIDFNSKNINKILSSTTNYIIDEIKKVEYNVFENEDNVFYIPFGAVSNKPTLSLIGPKIPLKYNIIGNTLSNIVVEMEEYGINNVLLKVSIEMNINTQVILPYVVKGIDVNSKNPIILKVIQGKIPQVYGGLYSSSSSLLTQGVE